MPELGRRPVEVPILAWVLGQIGLHSAMAGVRMAAPLQVLREGHSAWAVGLLMALFAAAPVLLALPAGRWADRHGYHRPVGLAVAMVVAGGALAWLACWFSGTAHLALLSLAACSAGAGANIGLIAIQRAASRAAEDSVQRVRVFSWLGLAPSISNVVGPVTAGLLIDAAGFPVAYAALLLLPLLTLATARRVPREPPLDGAGVAGGGSSWDLWKLPGLRRLMLVNWLLGTCWDVHSFAVPILGHERGFSASTIGLVLGVFPLSVSAVRLLIPMLAHRMDEVQVLRAAMIGTAVVFAVYPLVPSAWLMGCCAVVLGVTLGAVQPMIMSTLHHLTPAHRHGEAIAMRSMTLNFSSALMPLLFGAAGTTLGVAPLFWLVGGAVGAGSRLTARLDTPSRAEGA